MGLPQPSAYVKFGLTFFFLISNIRAVEMPHRISQCESGVRTLYVSKALEAVKNRVAKFATSNENVIIRGPTGVGKSAFARWIHKQSGRPGRFTEVNIPSVPIELIASELFGHTQGAFTGAAKAREGGIRQSHKGTFFLDEIGDIPIEVQTKLLRFVETSKVKKVGSDMEETLVDVRILSATHVDLDKAIKEGRFREDLFFRLSILEATLPSLDEWGVEKVLLARHLLKEIGRVKGKEMTLHPDTEANILDYYWPGNIRQLENLLIRAVVLNDGKVLEPHHLDIPRLIWFERRGGKLKIKDEQVTSPTPKPASQTEPSAEIISVSLPESEPVESLSELADHHIAPDIVEFISELRSADTPKPKQVRIRDPGGKPGWYGREQRRLEALEREQNP